MVVIASRQTGQRPETIRTKLARFMPRNAAAGWSVAWSAQTDRAEEIASQHELSAVEHLGCYGAAVAHALAQAEVAPIRLRVTAGAKPAVESSQQPITLEVRAAIAGPTVDPEIFESIVRRAQPTCPVWNNLTAEVGVRVVAVIDTDEPAKADPLQPQATSASSLREPAAVTPRTTSAVTLPRPGLPKWLSPRMAGLLTVALAVFAVGPRNLLFN